MTTEGSSTTMQNAIDPRGTQPLFKPIDIGPLHLENRIVMSPMTRSFSPGGAPGDDVAAYYRRRAEGGIGLIVTEGVGVDHLSAIDDQAVPFLYGGRALEGWKNVVREVHLAGGKIAPQLWHQGGLRDPSIAARKDIVGSRPSGYWGTPGVVSYTKEYVDSVRAPTDPMTENEIADIVSAFASASAAAKAAGFDAVAIHGAHGYLIDTFFWHDTNRREDRYGGSLRERARFGVEIIQAVRTAVGADFPILFRYSQHKQQDYKARLADTPQDLEALLGVLTDAGADCFDVSARRFYDPAFKNDPLTLAGWTKKLTGRPTIAVGNAGLAPEGSPLRIAEYIDRGEFDMIAVGRAVLHDPQWARKVRSGEEPSPFDPVSRNILT